MRPSRRRRVVGYLSFAIIFVVILFLVGWMLWSYSILSRMPALLLVSPNLSILWRNETLLGAIIGAIAAIVGGVVGGVVQVRLANSYQAIEKREQAIRTVFDWRPDSQHGSMRGIDLRQADLRGVKLEAASNASGTNPVGANLSYSRMDAADLSHAIMVEVDLTEASLQQATLIETVMEKCTLDRANLRETIWENAQLSGASLMKADFFKARLRKVMLNDSAMDGAVLSRATIENGSKLRTTYLRDACLNNSVFRDSDLTGILMLRTRAWYARFEQAGMKYANLMGSDFSGAVFNKVDLSQSDLSPAVILIDPDNLETLKCNLGLGKLSRSDSHAVDMKSHEIANLKDLFEPESAGDCQFHVISLDPSDARSIVIDVKTIFSQQHGESEEEMKRWEDLVNSGIDHEKRLIIAAQRTSISRAKFTDTNLRGACLRGVDMRRAKLYDIDLCDADLTDADLTNADLRDIRHNQATKWPTGFDIQSIANSH